MGTEVVGATAGVVEGDGGGWACTVEVAWTATLATGDDQHMLYGLFGRVLPVVAVQSPLEMLVFL